MDWFMSKSVLLIWVKSGQEQHMISSKIPFFIAVLIGFILSGCAQSQLDNESEMTVLGVLYPIQQMPDFGKTSDSSEKQKSVSSVPQIDRREDSSHYERNDKMVNFESPRGAIDLVPENVSGVWNLSIGHKSCKIATPQTKFGQGYRATPLRCSGIISQINSWAINGKKMSFYDESGRVIAILYSSSLDRLEGYASNKESIILSR